MTSFLTLTVTSGMLLGVFSGMAQNKTYKVAAIGFYNLENFYDTLDDPDKNDEEFTPRGTKGYTGKVYLDKMQNLSRVISEMATDVTKDGVAVLGVAEVENRKVLEDLCQTEKLKARGYKVIHHESPDERGVDVGLLYNPKYFKPVFSKPITLSTYHLGGDRPTRDILWVCGVFDGDTINIFVNHWPSRRGGEDLTAPFRKEGARICKHIVDSLSHVDAGVKCIVMGDLNDNPTDESCRKVLNAVPKISQLTGPKTMYNPWIEKYTKGIGTLAYQDVWSLFDQIILSYGLVKPDSGYRFNNACIYSKPYMVTQSGKYKGYPLRTYDFDVYNSGYSDHFPTYIFLVKAVGE